MTGDKLDERLERLEAFLGEWRLEAPAFPLPPELADAARTTFEWTLDGVFLLQRAFVPVSEGGPPPQREEESGGVNLGAVAVFLVGAGLSATGLEGRRRRRRARGKRRPTSTPGSDVRARALAAQARLANALERRKQPPERAVELASAASAALDREGSPVDDLGALVLAERGREALRGEERERCFFDPRHTGPTAWMTHFAGSK